MTATRELPRLLITLGDVAGIGPEIVAKAWPDLLPLCRPVVIGDALWLRRALDLINSPAQVRAVSHPAELPATAELIACINPTEQDLSLVEPGKVNPKASPATATANSNQIDSHALASEAVAPSPDESTTE